MYVFAFYVYMYICIYDVTCKYACMYIQYVYMQK